MAAAIVINNKWQMKMRTLNDCGKFLFNNVIMSDITFVFNETGKKDDSQVTRIHAHSWILSMLSPRFYDSLKDNFEVEQEIPVSDTNYTNFLESLRFIYTSECALTNENVNDIMSIAKKYSLEFLENDCSTFIFKSITIDNASYFLDKSIACGQTVLQNKLIKFIAPNINSILKTNSFLNSEIRTLKAILSIEDELGRIAEMEIFDAVVKWAGKKCIKYQMIVNGENKRRILCDAIKLIRFKKMTSVELAQCVKDENGILTAAEVQDLFLSICTDNLNSFGFKNGERKHLVNKNEVKIKDIHTSDADCIWTLQKNMREPNERSKFTVNKMIYLNAIYTAHSHLSQNSCVQIFNEENICVVEKKGEDFRIFGNCVNLTPLLIKPNCEYTIVVKYNNINDEFFCLPQQTLPVTRTNDDGIEFYFTELSQLLNGFAYQSFLI